MSELDNDSLLHVLRDFQDRGREMNAQKSFEEFRQDLFRKSPPSGGKQSSLAHFSPGFGMAGHLNTSSRAPAGPRNRPSGNPGVGMGGSHLPPGRQPYDKPYPGPDYTSETQFGVPSGESSRSYPSKYDLDRPSQPPPWIDDVDMSSIWYSPFEPVWPFGPPYYNRPREWNFPVGYNLNFVPPRLELCGTLRGMRSSWGVLSTIIETRKDQLLRLPWTIQRRDKPRAGSKGVDELRRFFRRPDAKSTFGQWARKLMDDLFVIDAPTIYHNRDMRGKLINCDILDGATIFPLIDDMGRRPDTDYAITDEGIVYEKRQPAFQQIIYGLPMVNLSEDQITYAMMRPLAEIPIFGYSPVQQFMVEATEAIRKTFYQLEFWRSGSMPELIVTVPEAWNPRQIAMFQAHFDALLSGQLSLKSKVRFLPGGMKPFDIKNASGESLWSDRDELLVRLACFAFSIPPTPFVKQTNRATAATAQQTAQEEGLYPLMGWWKDDIMDTIIQEKFGYDDLEFVFLPRPEVDLLKQAQIHQIKIHSGEMTLNEARAENGEEPYGDFGNTPLIYVGSGAFPVDLATEGEAGFPGSPGVSPPSDPPKNREGSLPAGGQHLTGPRSSRMSVGQQTPINRIIEAEIRKALTHRQISDAAAEAARNPSKPLKASGNYRKGHIRLYGLDITIENAKGSKRSEKDRHGRKWKVKMPAPYGYIRGTVGADGDQVDCYLGKHPESHVVFVIDQDKVDPDGTPKGFDEHKVMLGYRTKAKAMKDYLKSHFDGFGHERMAAVTRLSVQDFKHWLNHGELKAPISEQNVGQVVARRTFSKADTISSATNLLNYDLGRKKKSKSKSKSKSSRRHQRKGWLELNAST